MFLKKAVYNQNSNWLLNHLMHIINCGITVLPYQALERRAAQETLIGYVGL
jgi:hypothetical protein